VVASNESGVVDDAIFGDLRGATSSEISQIRPAILYGNVLPTALCRTVTDCKMT